MPKKKILLADDDPVFVEAVKAVLESRYDIVTASNGKEALEQIAREKPDVVVLDVMMDHLSEGFEVARKIKGDENTANIPVIMLTGVDEVYNYRMEVQDSYVPHDRYLEKPVEPEKLLAVIEEVITSQDA
jgi:CheY-like chemotaxis protein